MAVRLPVTCMHLPRTCSVPSLLFQLQLCAFVPLQFQSWMALPLFVFAPLTSMHLVPFRIGPSPRYLAFTTDGLSRL